MPNNIPNIPIPPPPPVAKPSGFLARVKLFFLVVLSKTKNLLLFIPNKVRNLFTQRRWFRIVVVVLGVLIILLLIFGYFFDPARIVKKQLKSLRQGNTTAAYNAMDNDFKSRYNEAQFIDFVKSIPALNNNKTFEPIELTMYQDETSGATHIYVPSIIVSGNNESYQLNYTLAQRGLKWRIWSMDVVLP